LTSAFEIIEGTQIFFLGFLLFSSLSLSLSFFYSRNGPLEGGKQTSVTPNPPPPSFFLAFLQTQ